MTSRNSTSIIFPSMGRLSKIKPMVTRVVGRTYSRKISRRVYPRIFTMEMDTAFFSIIILLSRYTSTKNSPTENRFTRSIISPMERMSCRLTLVMAVTSRTLPIYFSSISSIGSSEK